MYKISIYINDEQILDNVRRELLNTVIDHSSYEIERYHKVSWFKQRLHFIYINFRYKLLKLKDSFKKKQPVLGGFGGSPVDNYWLANLFNDFVVHFIFPNVAWDLLKIIIKKSYKLYLAKKVPYILLIDDKLSGPETRYFIINIPNNLSDDELYLVLDEAEKIHKIAADLVSVLNRKKIIFTYINKYWYIETKGRYTQFR